MAEQTTRIKYRIEPAVDDSHTFEIREITETEVRDGRGIRWQDSGRSHEVIATGLTPLQLAGLLGVRRFVAWLPHGFGVGRMRIHTSLTRDEIRGCIPSGVTVLGLSQHGSRSRSHAFELSLSGSGRQGGQWGNLDEKSATWDEWGIVLAGIFRLDPNATTRDYENGEHFRWATGARYDSLKVTAQHNHRWSHKGTVVTGSYYVSDCSCGAVLRRMARGYTFDALRGVA